AYRLGYVMVAARAPVIDLVVLDPANPRSVVYQLSRIEAHLAAVHGRDEDSRLSAPEQIATALAARVRTADPATIDAAAFAEVDESLMRLADVITTTYFTSTERSEAPWEGFACSVTCVGPRSIAMRPRLRTRITCSGSRRSTAMGSGCTPPCSTLRPRRSSVMKAATSSAIA